MPAQLCLSGSQSSHSIAVASSVLELGKKGRIWRFLMACAALGMLLFSFGVLAVAPDDHGNSIGAATLVGVNSVTPGEIEEGGDNDYFKIIYSGPGTLTVGTTGDTDTYGYLLDAGGNTIKQNDDYLDTNFFINHVLPAGTYPVTLYVRVRHYFPGLSGIGPYELVATFTGAAPTYIVSPSAGIGGTVNPNTDQEVTAGALRAFTVTPDPGYIRTNAVGGSCPQGSWSSNTWTTGAILGNCTVVFSFTTSYSVTPSVGTGGSVSPSSVQTVGAGETKSFVVTADSGYSRSNTVGGNCPLGSWGGNTWTTGPINADCTVSFSFTENPLTYTVTPLAGLGGTVNPSSVQTVDAGTTTSFLVTTNPGYTRNNTVGGSCPLGSWLGNTWTTGLINTNCTVSFSFTAIYNVTPSAGANGSVSPNTAQTVNAGQTKSFVVTPNSGYMPSNTVGGSCPLGSWGGSTWTTGPINADCTVSFSFTPLPPDDCAGDISTTCVVGANSTTPGQIETGGDNDYFRIILAGPGTLTAGTTGTTDTYGYLLDSTGATIQQNDDYLDSNFRVSSAVVAGTYYVRVRHYLPGPSGIGPYTLVVTFSGTAGNYFVTPSAEVGGMVNPNTVQTVSSGAATSFVVTPDTGYTHNTSVGGSCPAGSWGGTTWTTGAITSNCTVIFSFTAIPNTYTVTPSAGAGGTVNPDTAQTVNGGATKSFVVTANPGYTRSNTVEGTCPAGGWIGNTWTTGPIVASCNVSFSFTAIPDTYTVTPSAGANGSVSPNTPQSVAAGLTTSFAVTANPGYTRSDAVGGTCPAGTWLGNTWTTGAINANCTVSFSFTVPTDDHGNSIGTATLVDANSITAGTIETGGDNDYFKIILTGAGTFTVGTTGTTDTFGYLLNSGGTVIQQNDDYIDTNFHISVPLSAGTYYVRVRHYNSSSGTGAYMLHSTFSGT